MEVPYDTKNNSLASTSALTSTSTLSACNSIGANKKILLATALIVVKNKTGETLECRALLDSASQSNFITEGLCERLGIATKAILIDVAGIGQGNTRITKRANVTISSRLNAFKNTLSCLVLPIITPNIPAVSFDCDSLNIPDDLHLADPEFYESGQIDILIGASLFWDLLSQGQIRLGRNLPVLQKTHFGWIVSGPLSTFKQSDSTMCYFSRTDPLESQLQKFWEIEERFLKTKHSNLSDNSCETIFKETTFRMPDGRFVVSLPFKTNTETTLGDSKEIAIKRFFSLERKLARDKNLKNQYDQFMHEYINLGHMTKVFSDAHHDSPSYYIPHHPVLKPSSLTTKLRVVFDASAKTSNGKSLNDALLAGPTIQSDLFAILLRFRKHRYVLTADIAKMYRQVLLNPDHRTFQRIIWRFKPNDPLDIYELNTATYGITSSAFFVIRCLFSLAESNISNNPTINRIIAEDFYVDDLLTGAESINDLKCIHHETTRVLKSGGFELRKWSSNNPELLSEIQSNDRTDGNFVIGMMEDFKMLGLLWNPSSDILFFVVNFSIKGTTITKRQILSCSAQIFDPLGLIAPCTTIVKIII